MQTKKNSVGLIKPKRGCEYLIRQIMDLLET